MKKKRIGIVVLSIFLIILTIGAKVNAEKVTATVEIDHPTVGEITKTKLEFDGWLMSEDKGSIVEVYIDGVKQSTNIERYEREDVHEVIKEYGGRNPNPKPGYRGSIDISKMKDGEHKFLVVVKSSANEELIRKENTFMVKDYTGMVEIDSPLNGTKYKTKLNFDGWVMSEDKDSKVEIYIDGVKQNANIERYARSDVHEVIKGYGGKTTNPKPGYRGRIDVEGLKNGEHRFTIKNVSKSGKEITEKTNVFHVAKYDSKIEIDSPYVNQIEKNKLNFDGWLMSEAKNQIVEIYIDGVKQNVNIERYARSDVHEVIKGYGGKTTNPKPGYRGSIDISGLANGNHQFMVIGKTATNEELVRMENQFTVKDYAGKVEIDSPLNSTIFKTKLNFDGWVMSEDRDSEVEIYIDGVKQNVNIERYARSDVHKVIKGYGEMRINPTPGYRGSIDITKIKDGAHQFTVKNISENGKEIATKTNTFYVTKYDSKIEIDHPYVGQVEQNKLNFKGWVMSEAKNHTVEVYIDGVKQNVNIERYEREDVHKVIKGYGGKTTNPTPGYRGSIDITGLGNGVHQFRVKVIASGETIAEMENTFKVKTYEGQVEIDKPLNGVRGKAKLSFDGWEMSEDKNSQIEIYIDQTKMNAKIERYEREDVHKVIKDYGGKTTNPKPGYRGEIDASTVGDGEHTFTVKVLSETGREITRKTVTFTMKKYDSKVEIDTPFNTNYDRKNIDIKGWAMSEDSNAELEVYIDDVKRDVKIRREEREDVIEAYKNQYGGTSNKTPGYRGEIDYKTLTEGNHEIKVKLIASKTKEVIGEMVRSFHVNKYNTKIEIDSPLHQEMKKTSIDVKGWVMSEDKNGEIRIYLDGKKVEVPIERYEREDVHEVIKEYGGRESNPKPGYRLTIDSSKLPDGNHTLKVEFVSSESGEVRATLANVFKIKKYDGMLCVDSPILSNFNSAVEIVGWELSELDGSYIKASIDNNFVDANFQRVERQDVFDYYKGAYGGASTTPVPGFEGKIDLTNIPEGRHTIKVYLYTKLNELIATYSKEIYVYKNEFFGIDVSQHNGKISDWVTIRRNGVEYVIVRAGVRGYASEGKLREDTNFYSNVAGATNAGLKVGTYVFSQAVNEIEAVQEANLAIRMANQAGGKSKITLPIIFDSEYSGCKDPYGNRCGRADSLSREARTSIAKAFLDTVRGAGYTPMIYASSSFLDGQLDMSRLSDVDVWVAHYGAARPSYKGMYQMWQYTSGGSVPGISGAVDLNKVYKRY